MCDFVCSFESYALRRFDINDPYTDAADCIKLLKELTEEFAVWNDTHCRDEELRIHSSLNIIESAFNDMRYECKNDHDK
jgi:hypothetical protein